MWKGTGHPTAYSSTNVTCLFRKMNDPQYDYDICVFISHISLLIGLMFFFASMRKQASKI